MISLFNQLYQIHLQNSGEIHSFENMIRCYNEFSKGDFEQTKNEIQDLKQRCQELEEVIENLNSLLEKNIAEKEIQPLPLVQNQTQQPENQPRLCSWGRLANPNTPIPFKQRPSWSSNFSHNFGTNSHNTM